jgi:outer membrane protein TolC
MKLVLYLLLSLFFVIDTSAQQKDLPFFIHYALENSPLLKDYQNQIRSNQTDSMRIRAGLGPQVNAISNNLYAPVFNGWGYDEAITNGANISAQVSVSKEIVGRRNRENQYQALRIQSLGLQNTSKISEQDLIKNVSGQYITAYGSWRLYNFNADMFDLLKKEELIIKRLTEQNVYKQTDYLSFRVTLQEQEFQLVEAKSQFLNDLYTLHYLCGMNDTTSMPMEEPGLSVTTLPEIQNSVFYQSFINDSLKLSVQDKQIDFSYKPRVNLFGDAGYNSSWIFQPWKNFGASAGINLNVPIYDGHQRKMQHDKNFLAEQTRQNYRSFYVKQYQQQINQLFQQLKANQKLSELLIQQSTYTQALIDANHKLFETGEVQVTDYIMAIHHYLTVKNAMVQNIIEKYQIINQINYWNRTK